MKKISLLDCTMRDGGYLNDWEFGRTHLISIFERLANVNVDIIEVGFLDERRPYDKNRSIMPSTECVEMMWGKCNKRPPMVVGMIDYGTCSLGNLQPCSESFLDGIRVIFKKHIMKEAMEFCRQIKGLGYKVFSQLVSITSYSDEELYEIIDLVNDVEPYAVSIVDTYGMMHPKDVLHYYEIMDERVAENIKIGFHAHNNFQLAYANSITFIDKDSKHDIIVDGTILGMGKNAGNAPLELLSMYLNENYGTEYNIQHILEATEESVMPFFDKVSWGYKMFFFMSAANKCHPKYVEYMLKKDTLSISKIDEQLKKIEPESAKLLYDKDVAEILYKKYLNEEIDDKSTFEQLGLELRECPLLVIGPGKNIKLQRQSVERFILEKKPIVISINFIPDNIDVDYVFVTKRKRYQQMVERLYIKSEKDIKVIATSNVTTLEKDFEFVINRNGLLDEKEDIKDNSFVMLIKILYASGIRVISCAGLDGYSCKEENYLNPQMEYAFVKSSANYLNAYMKKVLYEEYDDMKFEFITFSYYTENEDCYGASF